MKEYYIVIAELIKEVKIKHKRDYESQQALREIEDGLAHVFRDIDQTFSRSLFLSACKLPEKEITMTNRYRIIRYFFDHRPSEYVKTVTTMEEAQDHCSREDTKGILEDGIKWFDGYVEVKNNT